MHPDVCVWRKAPPLVPMWYAVRVYVGMRCECYWLSQSRFAFGKERHRVWPEPNPPILRPDWSTMVGAAGGSVRCGAFDGGRGGCAASAASAARCRVPLARIPSQIGTFSPSLRREAAVRPLSARAEPYKSMQWWRGPEFYRTGQSSTDGAVVAGHVPAVTNRTQTKTATRRTSSDAGSAVFLSLSALVVAMLTSLAAPQAASALAMSDLPVSIPGLVGDSPLREGFVSGFLLIFFSEIGDKTFFIALLLALQRPRGVVFTGTFSALAIMTVISVGLGRVLHEIDELFPDVGFPLDDALAVALLVFFGVQTLASASEADETAAEEKGEAQEVVDDFAKKDYEVLGLVASTFALVFAAEWGDKSFLATIALAAASDPLGVIGGAVTGHGVATVIAVLGGSFLGRYLSERTVQYIGGSLFLVFAAATVVDIFRGV